MKKISQTAINKRVFNQKVLDLHIKEFMLGQTVPYMSKDKITLDVGAACGMYGSFFAKHSSVVFCYEAVPEIFKQLEKTCSRYDNMYCANLAICDKNKEIEFFVDDKRLSNNSIYNLVDGIKIKAFASTLDNLELDNVGFIKIDTEGSELSVINGAKDTIESNWPNLMIEVYPEFLPPKHCYEIFYIMMKIYKYKVYYNYKGEGLRKIFDVREGIDIANSDQMIKFHDGDFLFVR